MEGQRKKIPRKGNNKHKVQGDRTQLERKRATGDDVCDTDKGYVGHGKKLEFYLNRNGKCSMQGNKTM